MREKSSCVERSILGLNCLRKQILIRKGIDTVYVLSVRKHLLGTMGSTGVQIKA